MTECFMSPCSLQPGWYVTVHISNVPRRLAGGRGGSTHPYGLTCIFLFPPSSLPLPPLSSPLLPPLPLQTEHRNLSSIPLVVFGLLQHEHKARKLKTCWKLAAGPLYVTVVYFDRCQCYTLCSRGPPPTLSLFAQRYAPPVTANSELIECSSPYLFYPLSLLPSPSPGPTGISLWSTEVLCSSYLLTTHSWQQTQGVGCVAGTVADWILV